MKDFGNLPYMLQEVALRHAEESHFCTGHEDCTGCIASELMMRAADKIEALEDTASRLKYPDTTGS